VTGSASTRHVGADRESARTQVHQRVERIVNAWRDGEEAMGQILDGRMGYVPSQGRFQTVISVSGENVTIRGFVDSDGMVKIGTAFIP
jgi:hypothetical protein